MKRIITDSVQLAQTKVDAIGTTIEPMRVFAVIFGLSAVAGLALLIANGKRKLGFRVILGSFMISGVVGLVVALLLWSYFGTSDLYLLIGVSMLAGIGGNTTLGMIYLAVCKRFGLNQLIEDLYHEQDEENET